MRKRLIVVAGILLALGIPVVINFVALGGGSEDSERISIPVGRDSSSLRLRPTPTPTPSPIPTPPPTATPIPGPTAARPPVIVIAQSPPQPPAPAPERGLTAEEMIECEFGQFDGWDDAFNLRPYGFTFFPAPLKLTADPIACEDIWLAAYDDGYSRGTNDKCNIISDYIGVASSGELEFCSLEPPPPPTPAPYVPILSAAEAAFFATNWMCCDADSTLFVARRDYPSLSYHDFWALPQDCTAEFDINYLWWVVVCEAYWIDCFAFECATLYTLEPLCVSDLDYDVGPCGLLYGF